MIRKLIYLIVMASLLTFSSSADTVVTENFPNPGDTTTTVTTSTTTSHTTNNLLSQNFTDGTWEGPNQDTRHGSGTIAGIGGEYVQSTIAQSDTGLTNEQIQRGFTSTLGADIWFWDTTDNNQSVTMTQTYDDKLGTVTTQNRVVDYVTTGYNTYTDTITVGTNLSTQGELTAKYGFTHTNTTSHRAADLKLPTLTLGYTNVTTSSTTSVEYCWQKVPTTCPAQDEIAEVETILETFEDDLEDLYLDDIYQYEEQTFIPEEIDFEYVFNPEIFEEEEYEIEDNYLAFDEFFFEDDYYQDDYYEEFELEEFIPEDMAFEEVEYFEEMPTLAFEEEYFEEFTMNELPPMEEMYFDEPEYFEEEMYIEVFTDDAFIEEFDEMFEEMPMEEMSIEMAEEIFEEMFEEYFEEEPPMEMVEEFKEEIIEEPMDEPEEMEVAMVKEEVMEEPDEVMEEPSNEIEEQSSSEEPIADEPQEAKEDSQQEETVEESAEVPTAKGSSTEEPTTIDEDASDKPELETELEIKVAAIEKVIKSQIKNTMQQTTATLNVINEVVSREMVALQPDMSSYMLMNQALFDTRQLPQGNPAFFNQVSLDSYSNAIYTNVASISTMIGSDPIVQHQLKVEDAQDNTKKAYYKLKELIDARHN